MNRVTKNTPVDEVLSLFARDGYVLMEDALTGEQTAEISAAYDVQLAGNPPVPGVGRVEVNRIFERDARFEQLMDHTPVFGIAAAVLGPDIEMSSSGQLDCKLPHTPAHITWHNDFAWMPTVPYPRQNFWVRCTYFLSDVTDDSGPFTLLPGSHLSGHACPWDDAGNQPRYIDGQLAMTGKAGACLINNTEIWHTNSPNRSESERRLIMICYKHAWMKQWQDGYETSSEFAARQTDPIRRQLCGLIPWHQPASAFPVSALVGAAG